MAGNFPELTNTKPQIKKGQRTPGRVSTKTPAPTYNYQTAENQRQTENLERSQGEKKPLPIKVKELHSETVQENRQIKYLKCLKSPGCIFRLVRALSLTPRPQVPSPVRAHTITNR